MDFYGFQKAEVDFMTPELMTPEQALDMLNQVAGLARLDRTGHFQVQQAVQILQDEIKKSEEKNEKVKSSKQAVK